MSELDRLIQALYSSLVDKRGFSGFLHDLVKQLRLLSGGIVMLDEQHQKANLIWIEGLDIDSANQFLGSNVERDPLMKQLRFTDVGELVVMGDEEANKMLALHPEFFSELNADLDIYYAIGSVLSNDGVWSSQLYFHRSRNQGAFSPDDCKLIRQLLPHIQHAMQLFHIKQSQDKQRMLCELLFDQIQLPVILLDDNGKVCHFNQQAQSLVERSHDLHHVNGRLHISNPRVNRRLNEAISSCMEHGNAEVVSSSPEESRYSYTIAPLVGSEQKGTAIFVYNPESILDIDIPTLCKLFGLTEKEGVVCLELAQGRSPAEIAELHFLSYETVRTYIKRAMKKTNTTRQNELVAKLITSPANATIKPVYLQ